MSRRPATHSASRYNSYIFRLLEANRHHYLEIRKAKKREAEIDALREKDLQDFRKQVKGWMRTEKEYKAQIKSLELRLAKESKDGVGAVILTRHESIAGRSKVKKFMTRAKSTAGMGDGKRSITSAAGPEGHNVDGLQDDTEDFLESGSYETLPDGVGTSRTEGMVPEACSLNGFWH